MNKPMMDVVWPLQITPPALKLELLFLAAESDDRGRGSMSAAKLAAVSHPHRSEEMVSLC